jgi:transposase
MGRTKIHYLQALHRRGPKAQGCVENSQRVRFRRHVLRPLFNHVFRKADWNSREKQVKDRLKKWGLTIKNVKEDDMLAIARKRLKRKVFDDKESAFRVNKQPLTEKNIDRFLKRKKISDCTLLSITSPINGEVLFSILI